jgi:hypothetical protein
MENYEIRIVKKGHPFVLNGPHASDFAAIRRAQTLAEGADEVEVWRDLNCVYSKTTGVSSTR